MTKPDFILTIRQLIADGKTNEALAIMRANVGNFDTALVTDATLLESRYTNAFNDFALKGILPREDYDRTVAQINYALLEIIEKIEKSAPLSTGNAKNKTSGRLLHNIPGTMPVGKERRCIVRIAYDDEALLRDIKVDEDTTIQSVRIAEVMGVELLDFNETPAFNIRTITEEEQFISDDDYTQWLFMVKALREGKFPLTLKVAVIEEVNGKERKRDIVLEKEVFIISQLEQPPAEAMPSTVKTEAQATHFEDSTIRLNYMVSEEDRAMATSASSRRFSFSGIASTIAIIAVALTGWVAFQRFGTTETDPIVIASGDKGHQNGGNNATSGTTDSLNQLKESSVLNDSLKSQIAQTDIKSDPNDPNSQSAQNGTKNDPNGQSATMNGQNATGASGHKYDVATASENKIDFKTQTQYPAKSNKKLNDILSKKNTGNGAKGNHPPAPPAIKKSKTKLPTTTVIKPDAPFEQKPDSTGQNKIKIGDIKLVPQAGGEVTPKTAEVKTYRVRLILKGEMRKAEISVDGQSVDQFLKKNIWGVPQYIEFKSSKERHIITFKRGNVSCSVTDVLIENGDMTVEPCSFE